MRRIVTEKITLADGTVISEGSYTAVNGKIMVNRQIWPETEKYDTHQLYRLQSDPATTNKAHLVSASLDHLGFGHGNQAFPGHFFAANEIKIALCHLLLKYDSRLGSNANLEPIHSFDVSMTIDPTTKV
ncbi:hypothetical protein COCMIDRAFT_27269 [Bipolaris oryzae ATCC 44560]|uniref:Uncharacterized protein n=1 Tax=Bipolaris oryzae ATCC 44560 TaxID=930090 RepID=W6ZLC3_COCMI|nr:uncharacterized protein COCMIDRAFT_27269 [Bipolaris oryzae ATCC 44560]EUC44391.1 hypothetical protein COCMIDRAFT_27269 [Bipolaris oryzae ATCC 44560]